MRHCIGEMIYWIHLKMLGLQLVYGLWESPFLSSQKYYQTLRVGVTLAASNQRMVRGSCPSIPQVCGLLAHCYYARARGHPLVF